MRIASNIIDSIKAKADIVEVISEYVHLTQKGQNFYVVNQEILSFPEKS